MEHAGLWIPNIAVREALDRYHVGLINNPTGASERDEIYI